MPGHPCCKNLRKGRTRPSLFWEWRVWDGRWEKCRSVYKLDGTRFWIILDHFGSCICIFIFFKGMMQLRNLRLPPNLPPKCVGDKHFHGCETKGLVGLHDVFGGIIFFCFDFTKLARWKQYSKILDIICIAMFKYNVENWIKYMYMILYSYIIIYIVYSNAKLGLIIPAVLINLLCPPKKCNLKKGGPPGLINPPD